VDHYKPDFVLWLQPTSPLRTANDIESAMVLQEKKTADSIVSVCRVEHHPFWMKRLGPDEKLLPWDANQPFPVRRQELPETFRLNGAIYLIRREVLLEQ